MPAAVIPSTLTLKVDGWEPHTGNERGVDPHQRVVARRVALTRIAHMAIAIKLTVNGKPQELHADDPDMRCSIPCVTNRDCTACTSDAGSGLAARAPCITTAKRCAAA